MPVVRVSVGGIDVRARRRRTRRREGMRKRPEAQRSRQFWAEADARRMGNKRPKDKSAFLTDRPDLL